MNEYKLIANNFIVLLGNSDAVMQYYSVAVIKINRPQINV